MGQKKFRLDLGFPEMKLTGETNDIKSVEEIYQKLKWLDDGTVEIKIYRWGRECPYHKFNGEYQDSLRGVERDLAKAL